MVHFFGKNLNNKSLILSSLNKVYGLGNNLTILLLNDLGIGTNCRVKDLNQNLLVKILRWLEKNKILLDNVLSNKILFNINRLKALKNYKGLKHIYIPSLKNNNVNKKI
jgi:ribosomal protein S13